tara:strand:+ start:170 stop:430 length:261 start_codon:yes stop_codon:yes gene_type:complete
MLALAFIKEKTMDKLNLLYHQLKRRRNINKLNHKLMGKVLFCYDTAKAITITQWIKRNKTDASIILFTLFMPLLFIIDYFYPFLNL